MAKTMGTTPRPWGHHAVNPALIVNHIPTLLDFLCDVFGAVLLKRVALPDGNVLHAEVLIKDSLVMISAPRMGASPMPCALGLYCDDVDETYRRALESGARSLHAPVDQIYGHRTAGIVDPVGNRWTLHTVIEEVSPEELQRRSAAMLRQKGN
ncbi:VOC family protein [Hyalangium versicolor]|uniref:VOC family protein n=1 Tax=Hyalangium versicolor TaxID=2861190 RepID=UPI001CC9F31E|nr:VOC family protein [Hyalangium versicolor]